MVGPGFVMVVATVTVDPPEMIVVGTPETIVVATRAVEPADMTVAVIGTRDVTAETTVVGTMMRDVSVEPAETIVVETVARDESVVSTVLKTSETDVTGTIAVVERVCTT